MGFISFIKDAGEKVFGWNTEEEVKGPTPAEIASEKENRRIKANAALEGLVVANKLAIEDLKVDFEAGKVVISGKTELAADAEKAALVVGNIKGVSEVTNNIVILNPEPEAVYHTVVKGEFLSKIAKKYYGNANRYQEIFEANKPMLKDVDLIYPGQVLRIPGAVVQA